MPMPVGKSTMMMPQVHSGERAVAGSAIVNAVAGDYNGKQEYALRFESDPEGLDVAGTVMVTPANMEKVKNAFTHAAQEAASLRKKLSADGGLSDDDHAKIEVKARQVLRKDLGVIR